MKTIKLHQRIFGKRIEYCVLCDECYDIAKRSTGWAVTKDGELIDNYIYATKWAAAERIPNSKFSEAN